jgi:hypothetical protein
MDLALPNCLKDDEIEQKLYNDYISAKHKYFTYIQPTYQKKYEEYIIKSEKIYTNEAKIYNKPKVNKQKEIKRVYRKLSLIFHPDKYPNASNEMQLLNQLYEQNDLDTLLCIENSNTKNLEQFIEQKKYKDDIAAIENSYYYIWNISGHDFAERMTKNEYIEKLNKQKCEYEKELNNDKEAINMYISSNKQYEELIRTYAGLNNELKLEEFKEQTRKNTERIEYYNKEIINNTELLKTINEKLENMLK